jgi:hypothetical protein
MSTGDDSLESIETQRDIPLMIVLVFGAVFAGLFAASAPPNLDSAWYLLATDRVLGGAVFGRDILETNPPLFLLFTAPPQLIANALRLDAYTIYCLWVGAVLAASAYFSAKAIAPLGLSRARKRTFACGLFCVELFVSGTSFGQRELVLTALALPFVLNEAIRLGTGQAPREISHRLAAGFAAFGLLFKPFYATVPAGLILWRVVAERKWTAAFSAPYLVMLALAVLYAASVPLLFPDWLALARTAIIPGYSAGFDEPWPVVFASLRKDIVLLVVAAACVWFAPPTTRRVTVVMIVVAILFYLGAVLQHKGWPYHLLPGRIAICCALLLVAVTQASKGRLGGVARLASGAIPAGLCVLIGLQFNAFQRDKVKHTELAGIIREAKAENFLAIRLGLTNVFPEVTEMKAAWGSRSPGQWLAAGAAAKESRDAAGERAEGQRLRQMATKLLREDIEHWRPAIVAVGRPSYESRRDRDGQLIDWLAWYGIDPLFRRVWSDYCFERSTDIWDVYRRCDVASAS